MIYTSKQERSRKLRKQGLPLAYIAETVSAAKSTVSLWCKDIVLSEKQRQKVLQKSKESLRKGRQIGIKMNKQRKADSVAEAENFANNLIHIVTKKELLITATALYWAEGSKSIHTTGFQFVNSDPDMIIVMKKFLLELGVQNKDLFCTVQINEVHKTRIDSVLKFWKNLLEFNDEQIGRPSFVKTVTRKIYENHDSYFGICRLKVRKSTFLKYRLLALIKALKNNIIMPV